MTEQEAIEDLIHSEGWQWLLGYVKQHWGPSVYAARIAATVMTSLNEEALRRVQAVISEHDGVSAVLDAPRRRLGQLKNE